MSLGYELSAKAKEDLADIWLFYERKSVALADRQIEAIFTDIEELILFPQIGRVRNELGEGIRVFGTRGKRLIFYKVEQSLIKVQRVLHGHMDIPSIFSEEN
jgi:plasmid stabilization system protein ParE